MHAKRTRFAKDIVAEVYEPKKPSNKVVIFAPGMPGMPGTKSELARFFNKKGYWFIYPRYRGTWESAGYFLDQEPTKDIIDVVETIASGSFQILPDGEHLSIPKAEVYIVGSSFGGPAAFFASAHPKVKKVVSMSGVVDWGLEGREESLDWIYETFAPAVFGEGYRLRQPDDWKKLTGTFFNPINRTDIDPIKILMIHSDDDPNVPYGAAKLFGEKHDIKFITLKREGHAGSANVMKRRIWKKVKKHFEN